MKKRTAEEKAQAGQTRSLVLAKVIAIIVFVLVMFGLLIEVVGFGAYAVPAIAATLYQTFSSIQSSSSSISSDVSFYTVTLPSFFFVILTALLQYRFVMWAFKKCGSWMIRIMKQ